MNRRATKSKLIFLSLLLALGAVSLAVTRARSIRTAWQMSHSRLDNSETIKLHVRSLCEEGYRYRVEGKYDRSDLALRQALRIGEASFGPEDIEVASVLNQLGMLDKYAGRFDEGERAYRRALAILERAYGPDDPRLADIYHNLGGLAARASSWMSRRAPRQELGSVSSGPTR